MPKKPLPPVPPLKLPNVIDGQRTTKHPMLWCLANRRPEGDNLSDLSRVMGVRPQSLYKWMRKCEADRHFSLPAPRALQMSRYFKVPAALFRPDLPWSE
jgi:hypothetical protein